MKSSVVLVRPQNLYNIQNYPPLGLIQMGTVLSHAGYKVKIMINDGKEHFAHHLIKAAADALFVGITATTAEVHDAIRLAKMLREAYGNKLPIVWGGWHVTLFPEQMEKSDLVDFAVVGEGEDAILKIAETLSLGSGNAARGATDSTCLQPTRVIKSPFIDLDGLPLPDFNLVPDIDTFIVRPLSDKFQEYYSKRMRWLPYESSRGCPYLCAFCINPSTRNRKYRAKNPDKVAYGIAELTTKHKLSHVKIIDDNFFIQINRVRAILKEMERLGVKYTWDAECRLDYIRDGFVDDELFKILKRSGLVQLTFGIESGSPDTLRRMHKGGKVGPESAMKGVEMCAKYDIAVRGSFVLDIPGDTPDDIMQTVKLIRKLRRYKKFACGVHTYRPYPKSSLCEDLIKEGKFYQPASLEAWSDKQAIRQFTDTSITRIWHANYKLSSRISFYESLESAFWLKPHQMTNSIARLINKIFIQIARWRNNHQFYKFSIDRVIYTIFKDVYIKHLNVKKTT